MEYSVLIIISQIIAEETRIKVKSEEEQASLKAHETQEIADDAQRDLSEALPALVRQSPHFVQFLCSFCAVLSYYLSPVFV